MRKFIFLADQARIEHDAWLKSQESQPIRELQFDEMETFEHTKCKPLSIPLAVCANTRKIIGFSVASMPAKGPLAKIALERYGPRADERNEKAKTLLSRIRPSISSDVEITTDSKTNYPAWIKTHFPNAKHKTVKGRRGCVVGQGELKKIGFDPLFSLNHTAAMIRAHMNRLFRRTWCTTKKPEMLLAHLYLYAQFHNQALSSSEKLARVGSPN